MAFPAGCVIVLLDPSHGQRHIINGDKKTVTCLSWSSGGDQQIVSGESGHKPAVKVWSVGTLACLVTLTGHKFGVGSVSFSPDNKFVISVSSGGSRLELSLSLSRWGPSTTWWSTSGTGGTAAGSPPTRCHSMSAPSASPRTALTLWWLATGL